MSNPNIQGGFKPLAFEISMINHAKRVEGPIPPNVKGRRWCPCNIKKHRHRFHWTRQICRKLRGKANEV